MRILQLVISLLTLILVIACAKDDTSQGTLDGGEYSAYNPSGSSDGDGDADADTEADADSDGLHIATLLCALFLRHFRPLVSAGHVYIAMPPLYRIDIAKETFYALDDAERQGVLDRIEAEKKRGKIMVTRFKGLGEMNPKQLRETTLAPDTRRLVQLTIEPGDDTNQLLDMLLAKKRSPDRKAWLEQKGDLADIW